MHIPVSDAKGQLTDLVRRAERGDDIVLTRHGRPTVRLVAVSRKATGDARRAILEAARKAGRAKTIRDTEASGDQNFLYGDDGLPG